MAMRGLIGQIEKADRSRRRRESWTPDPNGADFLTWPTCPPSTSLYIRGGIGYCGKITWGEAYDSRVYTIPDIKRDVAEAMPFVRDRWGNASQTVVHFDNPRWYRYYIVFLALRATSFENPDPEDWNLALMSWDDTTAGEYGDGHTVECETATEAEAAQLGNMWYEDPWPGPGDAFWNEEELLIGPPLCGVILRNDGTEYGFLPIDRVNRDRSYLWPADARPRWLTS